MIYSPGKEGLTAEHAEAADSAADAEVLNNVLPGFLGGLRVLGG